MKVRYKIANTVVWFANQLVRSKYLDRYPLYRPVDQTAPNEKYACGAYSLEGLRSLVEQGDGDMTVSWLISDDGWQEITEENAQEVTETINKDLTLEATRQEQKRLNEYKDES